MHSSSSHTGARGNWPTVTGSEKLPGSGSTVGSLKPTVVEGFTPQTWEMLQLGLFFFILRVGVPAPYWLKYNV